MKKITLCVFLMVFLVFQCAQQEEAKTPVSEYIYSEAEMKNVSLSEDAVRIIEDELYLQAESGRNIGIDEKNIESMQREYVGQLFRNIADSAAAEQDYFVTGMMAARAQSESFPEITNITFITEPDDAEVHVNDKIVGNTTCTKPLKANRWITIRITKDGYHTIEEDHFVRYERAYDLEWELEKRSPK